MLGLIGPDQVLAGAFKTIGTRVVSSFSGVESVLYENSDVTSMVTLRTGHYGDVMMSMKDYKSLQNLVDMHPEINKELLDKILILAKNKDASIIANLSESFKTAKSYGVVPKINSDTYEVINMHEINHFFSDPTVAEAFQTLN